MLSLEDYVKQGLLIWPGGDDTTENEEDFGTQKQWKQKMLLITVFLVCAKSKRYEFWITPRVLESIRQGEVKLHILHGPLISKLIAVFHHFNSIGPK